MSKISSSNENFYSSIKQYQKNIDAIFGTTANIEDTEFYELCKKFSDIGLNAPKRVIEETCDVQGYFQDNDINIAVIEKEYDIADDISFVNTSIVYDGSET